MPNFVKGGNLIAPFGKNSYKRSTKGCRYESYTLAAATIPGQIIDGVPNQKIVQPGTALAKITAGPDAGKVGPYIAGGVGVQEVQTLTASGTVSGGTYTITVAGQTTAALAFNASAATVQAALEALNNFEPGDVVVTGGPVNTTPLTFTYWGSFAGDVPAVTVDTTLLTGSTPGITVATPTAGTLGGADGRSAIANLVGVNDTWLPWQTMERDVEISALYTGVLVQGWCFEMTAAGVLVPLANATADALRSVKGMDILFK